MEAGKGHEAELPSGRSLKGKGEGMNGAVSPEEIEKGKGFIQKGKMMQDEAKGHKIAAEHRKTIPNQCRTLIL